jgi:PAS domain-containing protein
MTDPSPANIETLHNQRDWLHVTLLTVGDAVITTDGEGRVTFLNPVAESLMRWRLQEAVGHSRSTA